MTALQKELLLAKLDDLGTHFNQVNLVKTIEKAHELITGMSHDYSVLAFRGEITMESKPLFEFNTDCLSDAKDVFKYWAPRMLKDGCLILQDNNDTESFIDIHYGE